MTPKVYDYIVKNAPKLTGRVLEVGSFNVNGGVRDVVTVHTGIDLRNGAGVDLVIKAEELPDYFEEGFFDSVVTTETLEHVENWKECLTAINKVVKPNGWWVCTMASLRKGKHDYPNDFWRFTPEQIEQIFPDSKCVDLVISLGWCWQNKTLNLDVVPMKVAEKVKRK
jgi:predicted SAM-dependent methyltransferase